MKVSPPAILGALLFFSTGSLAAIWAVVSVARGEYLSALVVLSFALMLFGFSIPLVKIIPGRVFPRAEWDAAGTTIRPDRGIELPAMIGILSGVLAAGLFAVFFPLGKLDIPVPSGLRFMLPFISAALVAVGLPILWKIFRMGGVYRLQMSPDGFVVNAGGGSPRVGSWGQVVDVTDAVPGRTAADDPNTVVLVLERDVVIKLPGGAFTPDGVALRRLVYFYWQHPLSRDELTDDRAFNRLLAENFRAT